MSDNIKFKKYFNSSKIKINSRILEDIFDFYSTWDRSKSIKDIDFKSLAVDRGLPVKDLKELIDWFQKVVEFLNINLQLTNAIEYYRFYEQTNNINRFLSGKMDKDYFIFQENNIKDIKSWSKLIDKYLKLEKIDCLAKVKENGNEEK